MPTLKESNELLAVSTSKESIELIAMVTFKEDRAAMTTLGDGVNSDVKLMTTRR